MRDKIILTAIKVLNNLGVRFTIDDIKDELNISKKTVYKYFESKEELAQACFSQIIEKTKLKQEKICCECKDEREIVLLCLLEHMEIYRLQSEKIFNLYSLNQKLKADVQSKIDENWNYVSGIYVSAKNDEKVKNIDDKVFRIIVEGIFLKICNEKDRKETGYSCLSEVLWKC